MQNRDLLNTDYLIKSCFVCRTRPETARSTAISRKDSKRQQSSDRKEKQDPSVERIENTILKNNPRMKRQKHHSSVSGIQQFLKNISDGRKFSTLGEGIDI